MCIQDKSASAGSAEYITIAWSSTLPHPLNLMSYALSAKRHAQLVTRLRTRDNAQLTFLPKKQLVEVHSAFRIETFHNILLVSMNIDMEILIQLDDAFKYPGLLLEGCF